ncbi:MASE3 domain-containing protein [Clostridium sp. OS1-26]|uniref:MASE3 domain-containing protein n=1 Tax=Clostridium sp. OS1-26 TaxID=3070681 RepID=UPI0027E07D61|nr:MASE3 domain-containing protein [Clostridium sp. OS1-26]WML37886.1 MASE3 domain-containing protein [Clostridium sp. OS1-26]
MNTKIIERNKISINLEVFKNIAVSIVLIIAAVCISFKNYLLFHTLIEIASVTSAFIISIIAINTYKISYNSYFTFLGMAFAFIGSFNLLHAFAYKGMGIFQDGTPNLATQLWIVTKFIESISILVSFNLLEKKLKEKTILLIYLIASILLLMSIFLWNIFPACYIEGSGLTLFKKISEYIIVAILIFSILALVKKNRMFHKSVYIYMIFSLITMIISGNKFYTIFKCIWNT